MAVLNDGTYSASLAPDATYTVYLTTATSTTGIPTLTPPAGYVYTGENISLPTIAGNDGLSGGTTADGILSVGLVNANILNVNFGINRIPTADAKSTGISTPTVNQFYTLNGAGGNPPFPSGLDPEDQALSGTLAGKKVSIAQLPTNGELWYNGSVITSTGELPGDFDPSLLQFKATGSGYESTSFTYVYVDAAGTPSEPATYSLTWTSPLPVKLVSFMLSKEGGQTGLTWTTSEEVASDSFEIQHSTTGKSWSVLGSIRAKGESHELVTYTYIHSDPVNGENLYRLKMIDIDGTYSFSSLRSIHFDIALNPVLYPNPASVKMKVDLKGYKASDILEVRIVSLTGNTVLLQKKLVNGEVDVKHVPSGTYLVVIKLTDGTFKSEKMVILK